MYQILLVIFLLVAIALIVLILLQQNKNSDIGASFGMKDLNALFGSRGSSDFMIRITVILAIFFFFISLILGNMNNNVENKKSKWDNLIQFSEEEKLKIKLIN